MIESTILQKNQTTARLISCLTVLIGNGAHNNYRAVIHYFITCFFTIMKNTNEADADSDATEGSWSPKMATEDNEHTFSHPMVFCHRNRIGSYRLVPGYPLPSGRNHMHWPCPPKLGSCLLNIMSLQSLMTMQVLAKDPIPPHCI